MIYYIYCALFAGNSQTAAANAVATLSTGCDETEKEGIDLWGLRFGQEWREVKKVEEKACASNFPGKTELIGGLWIEDSGVYGGPLWELEQLICWIGCETHFMKEFLGVILVCFGFWSIFQDLRLGEEQWDLMIAKSIEIIEMYKFWERTGWGGGWKYGRTSIG